MANPRSASLEARRPGVLLAATVTILILAVTLLASLFGADLHRRAVTENRVRLIGLSSVLSDQADRAFQSIELVQQAVLDEIRADGITTPARFRAKMGLAAVHATLRARVAALPQVNAVTVLDDTGRLLNFSRYWPIPAVSLADRDYFQTLSTRPDLQRFISEPVRNRGDGTWTLYIARKVTAPDGTFLGLVLGAVELQYFERLYAQIAQGQDYTMSMFRSDGALLVRYPRREATVGRRFSADWLNQDALMDPGGRMMRTISPVDGKDRFVASHMLAHYPIILNVSRTVWASLAPWRQQVMVVGLVALLLDLGLAGLAVLGLRLTRGQAKLAQVETARSMAEERARGEAVLRQQYARFGVAMNEMSQGLCMFDGEDRLAFANVRLAEVVGLAEPPLPGTGLEEILHQIFASLALSARDARWSRTRLRALVAARTPDQQHWELPGAQTLSVHIQPMVDGGWPLTCEDVTERRLAEARIAFLAHHDPLTRLPNRALFHNRLDEALRRAVRVPGCAVLCVDLDGFKEVNDTCGHSTGDLLLQAVAARLRDCGGRTDTVARLGGDEFAIIHPGGADTASALAARMLGELSRSFDLGDHQVTVGASIGFAVAEGEAEELLRHADMALYVAKSEGRNRVRAFEPSMNHRLQERRSLAGELRRALDRGEFELFFQPLCRVATRQIVGFEALLRWRHPDRGLVGPDDFIDLAEEAGLIVPIGDWVLHAACAEAASWPAPLKVAVNLSAVQLRSPGLVPAVIAALQRSGLSPKHLEFEITETVLLQETQETLGVLAQLHELGISIAMDDFGTGYSSLSYLRAFRFDKVKIDRSFVQNLHHSRESRAIVRAVIGLCTELGMTTLAEGVETQEQLDILRDERCLDVQGFLFSQPCPADALPSLLRHFGKEDPCDPAVVVGAAKASASGLVQARAHGVAMPMLAQANW